MDGVLPLTSTPPLSSIRARTNCSSQEIEDNIENYREQKRKGGDGGMLNNLPFGTGTIMQGLLNK